MNKFRGFVKSHTIAASLLSIGVLSAILCGARLLRAQSAAGTTAAQSDTALIADFRRVEVASVSDALEQLTGKRMYMSHRMHPILTAKFAGFARTVLLKKDEGNSDPAALNGMLAAIDQGSTDSVYVMVVEDGEDIAGMGGLMGTAMAARGYAGAVIDGGVRDVAYLRKIGFPGVCDRHCAVDVGASLSIRRIPDSGDVRRGDGECGRHCRGGQRWRGRCPQGQGPGSVDAGATNGFQRAFDVCRDRTDEIDRGGG